MPTAAFLSFRLGLDDGVSVVARSWQRAFNDLGWNSLEVAGEGPVDRVVAGLEVEADQPPSADTLEAALVDVDLVVVENLLSIPMNLDASRVVAQVLADRPAFLHHHDPPWQRARFAHVTELPPDDAAWHHVTINAYTEAQFRERGLRATTVYNGFETQVAHVDRAVARAAIDVSDTELLFVHPVRAIERKNIPAALEIAAHCGATYWLTGQAEDGYGPELAELLANAECRIIHKAARSTAELYGACDLVLFPSTWEGFGNPPVEAALYEKPVVVGDYPVASELQALGFDWLSADLTPENLDSIKTAAERPSAKSLAINTDVVMKHLSFEQMTGSVKSLLEKAGW
jgi:glycosyltransferase involved in cell wall biosynthesis